MKKQAFRLHLPAIPHTLTHDDYSHCAFTGKVLRFSSMMRSRGFEVIHYGTEGSKSGATRDVQLFTTQEWKDLRIKSIRHLKPTEFKTDEEAQAYLDNPKTFFGELANWCTPLYEEFNRRFKAELTKNYTSPDLVCIALGKSYDAALEGMNVIPIETGIGYNGSCKNFRIFESHTWMARTIGVEDKDPNNYWFVIPNFFNILEFPYSPTPPIPTIGFLARIGNCKGCNIIVEIARRMPHARFVLCGQGDPTQYLVVPNVVYKAPIHGAERGRYLGSLTAFLAPTKYLEPFGTAMVEAQLCGTPVIASDWGAMSETIENFKSGVRCHTLQDYVVGVQMALDGKFDRAYVRKRAVEKYDMYTLAKHYEYVFKSVVDIHNGTNGWYSKESYLALTDGTVKSPPYPGKIHLSIAYFGKAFPNYFQLYLDSLAINTDSLVVHLYTNISLDGYECPSNLVVEQMTFEELNQKLRDFFLCEFGAIVDTPLLETFPYKLCEFKVAYHDIFNLQISEDDYFGWGDIDVIYGKISNFIDLSRNYDRIGYNRAHFMALRNTQAYRKLYKTAAPDVLDIFKNNTWYSGYDEGKFAEALPKNDHAFPMWDYMSDVIPEEWNKRWLPAGSTATFYDTYNMTKDIRHLHYTAKGLVVTYEDGETREVVYAHLQKRKFPDPTCRGEFYITRDTIQAHAAKKHTTVLTYCTGYRYEVYKRFVGTLYDTGFSGDVIIVVNASDVDTLKTLQTEYPKVRYHVDTLDLARQCQQKRYFVFNDLMDSLKTDYVLLCDSRDLYFQKNIELYDTGDADLVYFLEDMKIKDCPHNCGWLKDIEKCIGRDVIAGIGENLISCSGTTYGTVKGIREYLAAMCVVMTRMIKTDYAGIDQGIHNFLLYDLKSMPENTKSLTNADGFVNTLQYGYKFMNENNEIVTSSTGDASYVVHQWDRLPDYMRDRIYPKYDFKSGL
jgi:glycosyltransferase involved in cell wall biosynthesis